MEKQPNQVTPSLPSSNNNFKEEPLKSSSKSPLLASSTPPGGGGGGGAPAGGVDRLKRDEWSEGAVGSLLDAYESKWVLRNRAKLKGQDWEDVARHVSERANSTKTPKTQTQCKNKIESMKKRYRSESATVEISSWPLYHRLDLLLRGGSGTHHQTPLSPPNHHPPPLVLLDHQLPPPPPSPAPAPPAPPPHPPPPPLGIQQDSHESNGVEPGSKEDEVGVKLLEHGSDKTPMEMDSSTPPISDGEREKMKSKKMKMRMKRKKRRMRGDWEVAQSVRWLAEVVVRSEQARMETMKELERMRAEVEAKKGEMDLKRTEIIANTQLQIARLLAGDVKGIDSSLRIGRN
ncbi:trihelix transcription factor ASIL2-like [Telopea speciosissima]|uniref:trihelix transcription factor ASIL2-like n=1 Tax=Telopea speciosissima TaxID=54955 RepID=UPI001CC33BCD|nr:trihelix transcription factor ASIL2-like [Telopea speciosissima]